MRPSSNRIIVSGFSYLLLLLLNTSCNTKPDDSNTLNSKTGALEAILEEDEKDDDAEQKISYKSALPCDSCEGVSTTLELFPHDNTYKLVQAHARQHGKMLSLSGTFNTERGFENDIDATLYILNDKAPEAQQFYFLRETGKGDDLIELDGKRHKTEKKLVREKAPADK
jgi:uncharacterized lipoprotein NlpE involved in copper resistance